MNNNQLYVLAQLPPTPKGKIVPVFADCVLTAIREAEKLLGTKLLLTGGREYSDSQNRNYALYYGEQGMEEFGSRFAGFLASLPKFPLGQTVATPAALEALAKVGEDAATYIARHQQGDWGDDLSVGDRRANDQALKDGGRIFSAYNLRDGTRLWIITEAEGDGGQRASTCVMLPEDY